MLQAVLEEIEGLLREIRLLNLDNKKQRERCDDLWSALNTALDKQFKNMTRADQDLYLGKAREAYFSSWDRLDGKSHIMLATALSIHDSIRSIPQKDLSPVVIEFCRVFENELKLKLYDDFISTIDPGKCCDSIDPYTKVLKAANDYKTDGEYYLSMKDMIRCVKELKNERKKCSSSQALSRYLSDKSWNKNRLTDKKFTDDSISYTDHYRNTSAHPNIMDEDDVVNCVRLTKYLVQHFISCMPSKTA